MTAFASGDVFVRITLGPSGGQLSPISVEKQGCTGNGTERIFIGNYGPERFGTERMMFRNGTEGSGTERISFRNGTERNGFLFWTERNGTERIFVLDGAERNPTPKCQPRSKKWRRHKNVRTEIPVRTVRSRGPQLLRGLFS